MKLMLLNNYGKLLCDMDREKKDDVQCLISQDHSMSPLGLAATIAHEMGHNMGMSHDAQGCTCDHSDCIMTEVVK